MLFRCITGRLYHSDRKTEIRGFSTRWNQRSLITDSVLPWFGDIFLFHFSSLRVWKEVFHTALCEIARSFRNARSVFLAEGWVRCLQADEKYSIGEIFPSLRVNYYRHRIHQLRFFEKQNNFAVIKYRSVIESLKKLESETHPWWLGLG